MLEERATHHLATLQVRVANPVGPGSGGLGVCDQDLYHVVASGSAIRRLRHVCERLRRSVGGDSRVTVAEIIQCLGDRLGGSPGIAAYRGVAIGAGTDGPCDNDVWLEPSDCVRRFLLVEYTRFWTIPIQESGYTLVELEQGVRDRPLFTLERAIERQGRRPVMFWWSNGYYIGLGCRHSESDGRWFVDRPLDARSEAAAIREMGLTPVPTDERWSQRALRSIGQVAGFV